MKRTMWVFLTGLAILPLCFCAPAAPASTVQAADAPPVVTAAAVILTAPPTVTPTPAPTATPVPTPTPAPTHTPEPTPEPRPCARIVEEMAVRYARDGEKAAEQVEDLLFEMEAAYPTEARKWADVMDRWRTLDDRITINRGVLPDDLPDTQELCIVVLGYQLNANGTMKDQLKDRLKVVVNSAKKYPNARIVCTGGGTAAKKKSVTEAGQMAEYLKKQGVSKDRIIVEDRSKTTAQNARYTCDILLEKYPEVKYVAIVTGDYHVRVGVLLFEAESILRSEPGSVPALTVISNAACKTSNRELSALFRAGGLVELAGNGTAAHQLYYDQYDLKQWD